MQREVGAVSLLPEQPPRLLDLVDYFLVLPWNVNYQRQTTQYRFQPMQAFLHSAIYPSASVSFMAIVRTFLALVIAGSLLAKEMHSGWRAEPILADAVSLHIISYLIGNVIYAIRAKNTVYADDSRLPWPIALHWNNLNLTLPFATALTVFCITLEVSKPGHIPLAVATFCCWVDTWLSAYPAHYGLVTIPILTGLVMWTVNLALIYLRLAHGADSVTVLAADRFFGRSLKRPVAFVAIQATSACFSYCVIAARNNLYGVFTYRRVTKPSV